jgi:uncharacterized BrkB/YihY/UPF0761 family membrane protein
MNIPVAPAGVLLIVAGIVYKMSSTKAGQNELRQTRRRRQDAISQFNRPLSEREAASAAFVILFVPSPLGLIITGVVVIFLSITFP